MLLCRSIPSVENRRKNNTNMRTRTTPKVPKKRGEKGELKEEGSGRGLPLGGGVATGVGVPGTRVGLIPITVGEEVAEPDDIGELGPLLSNVNTPEMVEETREERTRAAPPMRATLTVSLVFLRGLGFTRFNS